jgi:hypothetical protein
VTIRIDPHTRRRMPVRGISEEEVLDVLRSGWSVPSARGRLAKEKVFLFGSSWRGRRYAQKKVKVVYVEEEGAMITVTAYAYYGEWGA